MYALPESDAYSLFNLSSCDYLLWDFQNSLCYIFLQEALNFSIMPPFSLLHSIRLKMTHEMSVYFEGHWCFSKLILLDPKMIWQPSWIVFYSQNKGRPRRAWRLQGNHRSGKVQRRKGRGSECSGPSTAAPKILSTTDRYFRFVGL